MLAVFDTATQLRPGRAVVDTTVNLAVRGMLIPPIQLQAPAALPAHHHHAPAADDQTHDLDVDEDLHDEDPDEDPEAVHELHDRLIEIRRALDDLGAVTTELAAIAAAPKPNASSPTSSTRSTSCRRARRRHRLPATRLTRTSRQVAPRRPSCSRKYQKRQWNRRQVIGTMRAWRARRHLWSSSHSG